MAAAFKSLFGETLMRGKDEIPTEEALDLGNKKAIGIYFSAHWCPPCRGFTPKLAEWYNATLKEKGMEVVFVSSDRDQSSFDEYFAEQPWLALPYASRTQKDELSKKFKIQGIPSFIILDCEGKVITKDGRGAVSADPEGADFPWTPKPLKELIGKEFVGENGATVGIEAIEGKTLGIYFSAHWCPPCRNFTPAFAEIYKALKAKDKNFEVIFASSDRDEGSFNEYFGEMPWLAIPFSDRKRKEQLSSHFGVSGIPNLVILDENREVINANAVGKVRADEKDGSKFPWAKDLIADVNEDPEGIDEAPSLVILQEEVDAAQQEANRAQVEGLAKKYTAEAKESGDDRKFNFFVANKLGPLSKRVRDECHVKEDQKFAVVLMDIQNSGAYYAFDSEEVITEANVQAFFEKYEKKELKRMQMGGEE